MGMINIAIGGPSYTIKLSEKDPSFNHFRDLGELELVYEKEAKTVKYQSKFYVTKYSIELSVLEILLVLKKSSELEDLVFNACTLTNPLIVDLVVREPSDVYGNQKEVIIKGAYLKCGFPERLGNNCFRWKLFIEYDDLNILGLK
jgi:hypothetical protein